MDATQQLAEVFSRRIDAAVARLGGPQPGPHAATIMAIVGQAMEEAATDVFGATGTIGADRHPLTAAQRDLAYDMALRAALFHVREGKDPEAAIAPMIRAALSAAAALRAGTTEAEVGHG